jgi:hypothetical protein
MVERDVETDNFCRVLGVDPAAANSAKYGFVYARHKALLADARRMGADVASARLELLPNGNKQVVLRLTA